MNQIDFVKALKRNSQKIAGSHLEYYANPPVPNPPDHLGRFSSFYRKLSAADQEVLREMLDFAREGSLFEVLMYLDNSAYVNDEGGKLELWHVAKDGTRVWLNNAEEDLLQDLFNNEDWDD